MGSKNTDQKFQDWAQQIRASDEEAFSELFHEVYPQLLKFAWRYTKKKSAAHDVVQKSMVKLWEIRTNIDPQQSLKSYLYQIVRSRALNHIRDTNNHTPIENINHNRLKVESKTLSKIAEPEDYNKKMIKFIEQLPGRQREAIQLSRFEGFDHEEISEIMDISPRTVNNHIVTALKTLRKKWDLYKKNKKGSRYEEE
ncbi:RNA polymerase sigma factor [Fodinibius halophilus]|uniref:RNA polymerase sigma-70 factor n=1 Tax=Fodinibius halophilus TaxID=1736908 RepID=A0A6M1T6L7_9BACT|nr:RNA polymerase sigma-70 factor [Fodinibius halophilus]NGP86894.1 RNA polymerase sigma-70 factor [Fodinibius halophilus]